MTREIIIVTEYRGKGSWVSQVLLDRDDFEDSYNHYTQNVFLEELGRTPEDSMQRVMERYRKETFE